MSELDDKIKALEALSREKAPVLGPEGRFCTFTALMQCRACGGGLPLLGPTRTVHCSACQTNHSLDASRVAAYVQRASMRLPDYLDEAKYGYPDGHPCPKCNASVDLSRGETCTGCGTTIPSFAPPAWLKAELPALVKIFGAERDSADLPAEGIALATPKVAAPIITRCPECGASLRVSSESERTVTCEHCNVRVFLPDDLWRSLHPVKRASPWSIEWEGDNGLETHAQIGYRKARELAR